MKAFSALWRRWPNHINSECGSGLSGSLPASSRHPASNAFSASLTWHPHRLTNMIRSSIFHFALVLASIFCKVAAATDARIVNDSEQHHRDLTPYGLPQWWLLNSAFSLPQDRLDQPASSLHKVDTAQDYVSDQDLSVLSLVLPTEDQREKDASKLALSSPSYLAKRSRRCGTKGRGRCRRGEVTVIPAAQVSESWKNDYAAMPEIMVEFSQKQAEETACKDLSVQLFRVDLSEHFLEPLWVRETAHLGMCPSKLQTRELGSNVMPPRVVETKCLCQQESCSNLGGDFRCQAVRKSITTWVRHEENKYIPSQELITIGCVCVQRASPEGKYAKTALLS